MASRRTKGEIRVVLLALAMSGLFSCGSSNSSGGAGGAKSIGGASGTAGTSGAGGASGTDGANGGAGTAGAIGAGGAAGGASTGGTSGITPSSKRFDAFTAADRKLFCDFAAQHYGGYGMSILCSDGSTLSAEPDQATCLSMLPTGTCAVTAAELETCTNDITCDNFLPDSCLSFFACP
jgi:hypothetical protein